MLKEIVCVCSCMCVGKAGRRRRRRRRRPGLVFDSIKGAFQLRWKQFPAEGTFL